MGTLRAAWRTVLKSRVDARALSVTSLLSVPEPDLAGDIVRPDGLDWTLHRRDPALDLEHGRTGVGGLTVAWARESLSQPGAPYSVKYKSLPGQPCPLPVGVSYFDPNDRISSQVFALVERDALPGVSLEFHPVRGCMKSLGRSPLEDRDAYEFTAARVVRWTHCATPVCPHALTFTKSLPPAVQVPEALVKILRDGRVGSEVLLPVIRKALAHHLPVTPARVVVDKAMPMNQPDVEDPQASVYDDAGAGADDAMGTDPSADPMGEQPQNGVEAGYAHVQQCMELTRQLQQDMTRSDSPELRKGSAKHCAKIEAALEDFKAFIDAHKAKLDGKPDTGGDEEGEDGDDEDGESASDSSADDSDKGDDEDGKPPFTKKAVAPVLPPPLEFDDDGILAGLSPRETRVCKAVAYAAREVRRYRLSELPPDDEPPVEPEAVEKADDGGEETLADAYARIERDDPAGYADLVAAHEQLRKVRSWAS